MADPEAAPGPGKEAAEPEPTWKVCCFAYLDCLATIFRTIVACAKGIFWTMKRCAYPIKETLFASADSFQRWFRPYKGKLPASRSAPTFGFGQVESNDGSQVPNFQY
mmetsp:Transcript_51060/g.110810  ORF Transcript_51060/g.110810 Transcript_51060/m.110810 type:complete len:107 (+) Transcript_51060:124-444(+)